MVKHGFARRWDPFAVTRSFPYLVTPPLTSPHMILQGARLPELYTFTPWRARGALVRERTLTLKWFEDSGVYWNMSLSSKYKNYWLLRSLYLHWLTRSTNETVCQSSLALLIGWSISSSKIRRKCAFMLTALSLLLAVKIGAKREICDIKHHPRLGHFFEP